mmetsp:Transcript_20433/g.36656  ORF Transcript_20433/g.36656 Transcript_20433/m.36656 type:complete len:423 (+) Transcript_20433:91-1359(+)|eukprot:CAMPEP_0197656648 /NCGR_PEP_ID=MMETSP1338-20131121/42702_1 /TAXON_ID=43686 ORGANISM="Pelagodinium beii, Strain RCC1491" /NCGR_SAMPLE_ID=MMETSP1338 /ASSEMBLY_ACC=CAM_ASM_000754 /LENGTH=422 /DNA_ID=CAMNT_0043232737 /DNA_START=30 /DNA_END=1298 /DNA_ORIENTATION=-
MKWLVLLALGLGDKALGRSVAKTTACSCDCCETSIRREADTDALHCSYVQPGMMTAAAPTCAGLCAKSSEDHVLDAAESNLIDTERFCFLECAPKTVGYKLKAGELCRSLSDGEKQAAHQADGNGRALDAPKAQPKFLAKKPEKHIAKLTAQRAGSAPPSPGEPWSSIEKPAHEVDKLEKEVEKAADKAAKKAKSVQDAAYLGAADVAKASRAADDARLAARFASNAEAAVHQILLNAQKQAKTEAMSILREELPPLREAARAAAIAAAGAKVEKAQLEGNLQAAAAAEKGLAPWTKAMADTVKIKNEYVARANKLAAGSVTAEQQAKSLETEARQWDEYKDPVSKYKAKKLRSKAEALMGAATAGDTQAQEWFKTARYIDSTLPGYTRQAEQGAYHEMAMVVPDVQAPLPPLVLTQEKLRH